MKCVEVYKELYHQEPFDVAFCPYRISPLGAHIDHQYGKINGLAIDKGIHMAYHPKQNGVVELQSLNFPKRAQFFVSAVPDEKQGDWADHLRGAAKMLGEKYRLKVGLSGIIEGSLPIGGLSSSASVIICFLSALCKVNAHKFIGMRPVGKYHFKRHFKPIAVFFAMSCATTIYTHLDTVMLGFMKTDADVGYYNAAVKIKTILVSIVTSLGVVLLPRASYYIEHKMVDEFYRIAHKAINFVFLIALPMMLYFIIFAKEGIFFLSGDAYGNAVLPMQIIMPTLIFIGLTNVMGIQMLVPLGREKIVLYSEIAGAVVDLIVNFILIPRFASAGAAIGTLIAEIVVWIVQFGALKNEIAPAYSKIQYPQMVVALAIGCAASVWVKMLGWNSFFTLLLSAILFFGSYGLVLILTHEPLVLELVNQIFGKVKKFIRK